VHWNQGDKNFRPEEDSRKLFGAKSQAAVSVFLLSNDGYALDINTTNDLSQIIPIGIRTSVKGNITLRFSGMKEFGRNTTIFLHDTKTEQIINLSQTDTYTFNKDEDALFVDGRLYLRFVTDVTSDPENPRANGIAVFSPAPKTISIIGNENLGAIEITDIQGRRIIREQNIENAMYNLQVPSAGVYFVRVMGETRKVIVK
jgi:hypothetical protein